MGSWFPAKKTGSCRYCNRDIAVGDRMYCASRGVYMCEGCGKGRESGTDSDMGAIEAGVVESLGKFPPEAAATALGQSLLYLGRLLDRGDVNAREIPQFSKEIRQALAQLEMQYPAVPEGDGTDEAKKRRERRLAGLNEEKDYLVPDPVPRGRLAVHPERSLLPSITRKRYCS